MTLSARSAPFMRGKKRTDIIMYQLLAALSLVSIVSIIYQFTVNAELGLRAILIFVVALLATAACDVVGYLLQKNREAIKYSYITAIIFALTLPVNTHLYVVAIGAIFATAVAKLAFGGFGKNILNPAIVGRIVVAVAFGNTMYDPYITDKYLSGGTVTAGFAKAGNWLSSNIPNFSDNKLLTLLMGNYQGALGETFTILLLVIAIVLIVIKVIDWRQPVFYLLTIAVGSLLVFGISQANKDGFVVNNPLNYMLLHLSLGGLMFGAVFMITDPVTTPVSNQGKIIASIIAGTLTMLLRVKIGAVEGVMYSIAFINLITPFIDSIITGKTTAKLKQRFGSIGAAAGVSLLIIGCAAFHPKASEGVVPPPPVNSVEYIGYAEGNDIQNYSLVKVTVKLYLTDDVFADLKYEYKEEDLEDGSTINGRYSFGLQSGEFYDAYVSSTALAGKNSQQLRELYDGVNVVPGTPGVTGSTTTCKEFVLAMRDALTKVPAMYTGTAEKNEIQAYSKVIVNVKLYILSNVFNKLEIEYKEEDLDSGAIQNGRYNGPLESGVFYDTYVAEAALNGKTVAELNSLYSSIDVVTGTPGVSTATTTANVFILAMRDALRKI